MLRIEKVQKWDIMKDVPFYILKICVKKIKQFL